MGTQFSHIQVYSKQSLQRVLRICSSQVFFLKIKLKTFLEVLNLQFVYNHFCTLVLYTGFVCGCTVYWFRRSLWNLGQVFQIQIFSVHFFSWNLFRVPRYIPWTHWNSLLTSKGGYFRSSKFSPGLKLRFHQIFQYLFKAPTGTFFNQNASAIPILKA